MSAVGVFVSASAFFLFFVGYKNYDVGFWSFLSGLIAASCFHLHWLKIKDIMPCWYTDVTLRNLNAVGFISALAGLTAMIWYIFLTVYYKIPVMPISESTTISAVWSMICGKWGILLMYHSRKYELILKEGSTPILSDNNA